eukprot:scaffold8610_cov73-Cylindrotheca_fusiformis.AAC.3
MEEHDTFGVYDNMPLLRSDRVELPGFQSLWNITDPLEIHMFLKVCKNGHAETKLFGHLYRRHDYLLAAAATSAAASSSSSTTNDQQSEQYIEEQVLQEIRQLQQKQAEEEEKYKVGTLMQVSDYRQDEETGHLLVLVQALARFVVISKERWDWMHIPPKRNIYYVPTVQRATIELIPDQEFVHHFRSIAQETANSYDFSRNQDVQGAACAGAIAEASQWRFFETQPQCIPLPGGQPLDPVSSLSPFPAPTTTASSTSSSTTSSISNTITMMMPTPISTTTTTNTNNNGVFQVATNAQKAMQEYLSQSPMDLHQGECSLDDEMFNDDDDKDGNYNSHHDASMEQEHVLQVERSVWLELDKLVQHLAKINPKANTQMPIPTQILSLMPRYYSSGDNMQWPNDFGLAKYVQHLVRAHAVLARNKYKQANGFQMVPKEYPPLRRARRLSYIVWNVFLEQDTMDVPSGEMQRVLEIHSISKRLEAGLLQLQTINRILQTVTSEN